MKTNQYLFSALGFFALVLLIYSCATASGAAATKTGAQLWGENCFRCHNTPAPETFSDVEWDVAMMHMRIRANLTETETVKIAEFLKSAN